jgi:hypothetical protein
MEESFMGRISYKINNHKNDPIVCRETHN